MTETNGTQPVNAEAQKIKDLEARAQRFEGLYADAEKKLKSLDGIDRESFLALKEEVNNYKREMAAKKDPEALKEELARQVAEKEAEIKGQFSKVLTEKEQALESTTKELTRLRVLNPAMLKAAEVFNSDALELIQGVIERDLSWDGSKIVVQGSDGKPRVSESDPRKEMTIDEYMEALATKYPSSAKPRGKAGTRDAGATQSANGTGQGLDVDRYLKMTEAERKAIPLAQRAKLAQQALSRRA